MLASLSESGADPDDVGHQNQSALVMKAVLCDNKQARTCTDVSAIF